MSHQRPKLLQHLAVLSVAAGLASMRHAIGNALEQPLSPLQLGTPPSRRYRPKRPHSKRIKHRRKRPPRSWRRARAATLRARR